MPRGSGWLGFLLACAAFAAAVSRAVEPELTHMTPPPQPPLAVVPEGDVTPVRELFNREASHPRLLVMLSPT